jgi:hypothetical protein
VLILEDHLWLVCSGKVSGMGGPSSSSSSSSGALATAARVERGASSGASTPSVGQSVASCRRPPTTPIYSAYQKVRTSPAEQKCPSRNRSGPQVAHLTLVFLLAQAADSLLPSLRPPSEPDQSAEAAAHLLDDRQFSKAKGSHSMCT